MRKYCSTFTNSVKNIGKLLTFRNNLTNISFVRQIRMRNHAMNSVHRQRYRLGYKKRRSFPRLATTIIRLLIQHADEAIDTRKGSDPRKIQKWNGSHVPYSHTQFVPSCVLPRLPANGLKNAIADCVDVSMQMSAVRGPAIQNPPRNNRSTG